MARQFFPLAMLAIAFIGLAAASFRGGGGKRQPDVLMIVVDTLRADRLGVHGNTRGLTPFLDGLAARGTVFLAAYAASSWTIPSVTSLFTSRYPSQHRVTSFGGRLADDEVTFAERLREARYVGGGFSANFTLAERLGYARGFKHWVIEQQPEGSRLRADGLHWLDRHWQKSSSDPVLLYFQFMEPHSPYESREPYRSRFGSDEHGDAIDVTTEHRRLGRFRALIDGPCYTAEDFTSYTRAYDAAVATLDDEIRLLFTELERRGFLDDALVVITADHGEEFGEHGGALHGRTLYNESIHVPLIFVGAGIPVGRRIDESVSLIDIAPTVLDLLDLPAEARFEGRSLRPLMQADAQGQPAARALGTPHPGVLFELPETSGRAHESGIIRGPFKVLVAPDGSDQSYDLDSDPGELHATPAAIAPQTSELKATLQREVALLEERSASKVEKETLDETTKERLRALGYDF